MRERAAAARDRGNSWAVRPELIAVREEVLALALPQTPVRLSRIPDFGEYLTNALASTWLTDCLTWIHQAAEQGYGLLLN